MMTSFGQLMFCILAGSSAIHGVDAAFTHGADCKPCSDTPITETCAIDMKVNLFASETGYFEIGGCDGVNPTLHLTVGKNYKFQQHDLTNWYHLVGFAYEHDGAHIPNDELEPTIIPPGSMSTCNSTKTCPAPMYVMNGVYQGKYSNIAELSPIMGDENFGLDEVEPKFFHPLDQWQEYGSFDTWLNFDQEIDVDIFYFCHIHEGMTARIKLLDTEGNKLNQGEDNPEIPYSYADISEYDADCGTTNITDFQLPRDNCPSGFLCEKDGKESTFADCLESMNCHMMASMTTHYEGMTELFIHQMIPHHQNAVNMAKALLKAEPDLECTDEDEDASVGCDLIPLLYDIVNVQNSQIIDMRGVLSELEAPDYANCEVSFEGLGPDSGAATSRRERTLAEGGAYDHGIECTPCEASSSAELCEIKMKVNMLSGRNGYLEVEGCEGVNPTLLMQVDRTYVFDQSDVSNWYHLIGFAYEADGAHTGVDELEPGIPPPGTGSNCGNTNSCPAPMYWIGDDYQGHYSNDESLVAVKGHEDFGLDAVEPLFFHPLTDWQEYGTFKTSLRFDDDSFSQDFFYFCHIHSDMTARIKLMDSNGKKLSENDTPSIPYTYDVIGTYDDSCGGFDLSDFQLPNAECPEKFVCRDNVAEGGVASPVTPAEFVGCIDAMNCAMMQGMTTTFGGETIEGDGTDDMVLFLRQMIPHHENAINMAKVLFKSEDAKCGPSDAEDSPGCVMEPIIRGIMVSQTHQIQTMQGLLERFQVDETGSCDTSAASSPVSTMSLLVTAGMFVIGMFA